MAWVSKAKATDSKSCSRPRPDSIKLGQGRASQGQAKTESIRRTWQSITHTSTHKMFLQFYSACGEPVKNILIIAAVALRTFSLVTIAGQKASVSSVVPDMRARCGRIICPLSESTRSTGDRLCWNA